VVRREHVDALIAVAGKRQLIDEWFFPDPLVSVVFIGGCDCEGDDELHIHAVGEGETE